ncbi:hypothetical protein V3C99_007824, partial [Haemonchus contortus]|uniref:G_PROTEIN_RECEP_F1_2 domain-containing protein n=1 Tax=Haemonchus contortus TaxID=6289 RepID=A0A7I4YNH0_HAECO
IYLQLAPIFGSCFSLVLLLNIAIDRLLSLMSFYDKLIAYYRELYLTAHILPAVVFGMIEVVLFFVYRTPDEFILCSFAIVMQGPGLELLLMSVLVICTLVIMCYLVFICFLKKIRMSVEGHEIRQSLCMHLLRAPTFGLSFSLVLLLSIALDRLLSLMSFYGTLIAYYRKLYLTAHILPAIIFGIIVNVVFFVYQATDEYILCSFAIVMQGPADDFLNMAVIAICAVVILCYLLFICFLNKIRTSTINVKSIYRCVLIITLAVIFGYFAAAAAVVIGSGLNVERFYLNLLAGLIACFSISITFFVYYTIRQVRGS